MYGCCNVAVWHSSFREIPIDLEVIRDNSMLCQRLESWREPDQYKPLALTLWIHCIGMRGWVRNGSIGDSEAILQLNTWDTDLNLNFCVGPHFYWITLYQGRNFQVWWSGKNINKNGSWIIYSVNFRHKLWNNVQFYSLVSVWTPMWSTRAFWKKRPMNHCVSQKTHRNIVMLCRRDIVTSDTSGLYDYPFDSFELWITFLSWVKYGAARSQIHICLYLVCTCQYIGGSRGRTRCAPPKGPDSFDLTYKFCEM